MANSNDKNGVQDKVGIVDPGSTMCNSESDERDLRLPITRVMSPSPNLVIDGTQIERGGVRGYTLPCGVCNNEAADPWVCSQCYTTGHGECRCAFERDSNNSKTGAHNREYESDRQHFVCPFPFPARAELTFSLYRASMDCMGRTGVHRRMRLCR